MKAFYSAKCTALLWSQQFLCMCHYCLTHSSTKIQTHYPWFAWPASKPLQHNCFSYNPYLISVAALGGGQVYQNLIITLKLFKLFEIQNILWSQVLWNCLKAFGLFWNILDYFWILRSISEIFWKTLESIAIL